MGRVVFGESYNNNNNNNNYNNNNLYLKSHPYINNQHKLCRGTKTIFAYIHIELWKCDLLKATTDDAPDEDRTRDPSAQSPMRYQLRQSAIKCTSCPLFERPMVVSFMIRPRLFRLELFQS